MSGRITGGPVEFVDHYASSQVVRQHSGFLVVRPIVDIDVLRAGGLYPFSYYDAAGPSLQDVPFPLMSMYIGEMARDPDSATGYAQITGGNLQFKDTGDFEVTAFLDRTRADGVARNNRPAGRRDWLDVTPVLMPGKSD